MAKGGRRGNRLTAKAKSENGKTVSRGPSSVVRGLQPAPTSDLRPPSSGPRFQWSPWSVVRSPTHRRTDAPSHGPVVSGQWSVVSSFMAH
jgi:hypothetical protein